MYEPPDHDGKRLNNLPAKAVVLSVDGWPTAARALLIGYLQLCAMRPQIWRRCKIKMPAAFEPQAFPFLIGSSLEPPDDAAGIAKVVLVVAGAGGKARQRAERVEIGADEVHLRRADGKVAREADVYAAAKSHGERVRVIDRGRDSSQDRKTYACVQAGVRRAEQRVSKDRALAEISGDSGTKQHVIHVLLRAGGKAQRGNAGKLLGVAAEVGSDAEMASEVECALGFPSIEIAAEVEIAAPQAAAQIIVGMKQGVSREDVAACCHLVGFPLSKAQHRKTQNG